MSYENFCNLLRISFFAIIGNVPVHRKIGYSQTLVVLLYSKITIQGALKYLCAQTINKIASLNVNHRVTLLVVNQGNAAAALLIRDDKPLDFVVDPQVFSIRMQRPTNYKQTYTHTHTCIILHTLG